ncbi:hypothetical protein CapIbe_006686, partial [Capra ibex]
FEHKQMNDENPLSGALCASGHRLILGKVYEDRGKPLQIQELGYHHSCPRQLRPTSDRYLRISHCSQALREDPWKRPAAWKNRYCPIIQRKKVRARGLLTCSRSPGNEFTICKIYG